MENYAQTAALRMAINGPAEDFNPFNLQDLTPAQMLALFPLLVVRYKDLAETTSAEYEELEKDYQNAERQCARAEDRIDAFFSEAEKLIDECEEMGEDERLTPKEVIQTFNSILNNC